MQSTGGSGLSFIMSVATFRCARERVRAPSHSCLEIGGCGGGRREAYQVQGQMRECETKKPI